MAEFAAWERFAFSEADKLSVASLAETAVARLLIAEQHGGSVPKHRALPHLSVSDVSFSPQLRGSLRFPSATENRVAQLSPVELAGLASQCSID